MRLVCISDTHRYHEKPWEDARIKVPDGDLLIHAGDGTYEGKIVETQNFLSWLAAFPHPHKVLIAGNHDWIFQKAPELARSMIPPGITYLEDDMAEIAGLKIYGSPWTPYFLGWAFNLDRGHRIREKWNKIPRGIDVLVTHGPPMGILDLSYDGTHVGCKDLRDIVFRVRPRIHVFGHIHLSGGRVADIGVPPIRFVNAAVLGEDYKPASQPIVIDL